MCNGQRKDGNIRIRLAFYFMANRDCVVHDLEGVAIRQHVTTLIQLPEYDGRRLVGVVKLRWRSLRFLRQEGVDLGRLDQLQVPVIVCEKIRYSCPPYWIPVQSQ